MRLRFKKKIAEFALFQFFSVNFSRIMRNPKELGIRFFFFFANGQTISLVRVNVNTIMSFWCQGYVQTDVLSGNQMTKSAAIFRSLTQSIEAPKKRNRTARVRMFERKIKSNNSFALKEGLETNIISSFVKISFVIFLQMYINKKGKNWQNKCIFFQ